MSKNTAYSSNENDSSSESSRGDVIEINYDGKKFKAIEIGMDDDWARIDDNTPNNILAVCSYGFASCLATVIRSKDGKYTSLRHDSLILNEDLIELIDEEVLAIQKISQQNVEVTIGFAYSSFREGTEDEKKHQQGSEEELRKAISEIDKHYTERLESVKSLKNLGYKIIDLPKATILIDKNGINTSIPDEVLRKAPIIDQNNLSPRPQVLEPELTQLNKKQRIKN